MNLIEIKNVSKKYIIAHENKRPFASLKEILSEKGKQVVDFITRKKREKKANTLEEFWALKNIDLNIQAGDRVALLGRNGAGKSTLLKLLSRITEPTTGSIKIAGRIVSLLEVGSGFHPDLTGRENIFFNGVLMGMTYNEILRKFDEIVAFADVEKFLDTPVKRYSSGMFMRLGFSISAHLDAEVMIIDEVLAVGDMYFQEKCLKKLNEIGNKGGTILFVSHNTNNLLSLCNKGILLEHGELKAFEPIHECVNRYLRSCPISGLKWSGNMGDEHIRIFQAEVKAPKQGQFFYQGEQTSLDVNLEILIPSKDLILGFTILNSKGNFVAGSRLCDNEEFKSHPFSKGTHQFSFHLDLSLFHPGEYQVRLDCSLFNRKRIINDEITLKFSVYSKQEIKYEIGAEKEGISLGNKWKICTKMMTN